MKTKFGNILFVVLSILSLIACQNDDDNINENLSGNYTGLFTVTYSDGTIFSNPVMVSLNTNNTYECIGYDYYIPAVGSGTYETNTTTINFTDQNIWTADFDWNLILNGTYNYTVTRDSLLLSASKNNVGLYEYQLVKTELNIE
ncbi:hypothetical protein [uncultured Formosa sp.]|uniref:hypothetical protein n=1 Tax=uncultured Formosa sp. TaxID=255435 RepID=UPI00262E3293|nr:hypothetical protein [uncultured Formosa sp.]